MLMLLLVLVALNYDYTNTQTCSGLSSYFKKSKEARLTSVQKGDYMIQALVSFTDPYECTNVTRDGVAFSYAMQYAIDRMNNETLGKYGTLGLQLDNVCRRLHVTMSRGIEIISLHRPKSVCRADFLKCEDSGSINQGDLKQATAVIGTLMSFTTIPLASLMSLYDIPQVSFSASSRLLSKKNLYKSFFRTVPSDTKQVAVMLDIFKKFKWNYVFAVGSDDDYGKLAVSDLKSRAQRVNICISNDEYIPFRTSKTKQKIIEVVTKIKEQKNAKVVVLFCYAQGLGDWILEEAQKQGVERIWLTSEAWNPTAAGLPHSLRNQTEGILTVSIKSYEMRYLIDYIRHQVASEWQCNFWLRNYLQHKFNCQTKPTELRDKKFVCENGVEVSVEDIMADLSVLPGRLDGLIDGVTSLGKAIFKVVEEECGGNASCASLPTKLDPTSVTEKMFNVSFVNQQGRLISFDSVGDPKSAFYTIENLQAGSDGKLKYVPIGNWTQKDDLSDSLVLDENAIRWPKWWKQQHTGNPSSQCSEECMPGEAVVGKNGCCWKCEKCTANTVSLNKMADECTECGEFAHTLDNINCIKTPLLWLEINDPAGMSIVIISAFGLLVMFSVCVVLIKLRHLIILNDKAPQMTVITCLIPILTFTYGPLHIAEPTPMLCQARNSLSFILLMMYAAILLIKTKCMTSYLSKHAERSFRGNSFLLLVLVFFFFVLLETVSVIAWLYIDDALIQQFRPTGVYVIYRQCEVSFTAARLVSTFIPCIILIIATFCAFRERNNEHSFYEPKFLSFTCIAMCIIVIAFLPTFKYVVGIYKAIVLAFTMDVFAYTFMACLVLPKVYIAVMRHRRGIDEFPIKPGSIKKPQRGSVGEQKQAGGVSANGNGKCTPFESSATSSTDIENSSKLARNTSQTAENGPDVKRRVVDHTVKQDERC